MSNERDARLDRLRHSVLFGGVPDKTVDINDVDSREKVLSPSAVRALIRTTPSIKVNLHPLAQARSIAAEVLCAALPLLTIHDDILVQVRGFKARASTRWAAGIVYQMADRYFDLFPRQLIWWSRPLANSQANPLLLHFGYPDLGHLCVSETI